MASALFVRVRRRLRRPTRRRLLAGLVVLVVLAGLVGWAAWPQRRDWRTEQHLLAVGAEPGGEPVSIDTTFYLPDRASAAAPVPAVLLAHGFGATKDSVREQAEQLAGRGYAVLAWTARGFGASGGRIHLDSPDYEVSDARRLLDWLATRPEVRRDGAGDPRVGVLGGSYGGALALLLAGYDRRVDAIVPMITWNDLATSLLPESSGRPAVDGVFKKAWAGVFFGRGADAGTSGVSAAPGRTGSAPAGIGGAGTASDSSGAGAAPGTSGAGTASDSSGAGAAPGTSGAGAAPGNGGAGAASGSGGAGVGAAACGRFAADVCEMYLRVATSGRADEAAVALLHRSSPSSVLGRITAPTLLIQGTADTLFPLSEADANARGIAATGTPVRVAWFTGGHDGGSGPAADTDRIDELTTGWLEHYLRGSGAAPPTSFTWSRITGLDAVNEDLLSGGYTAGRYPGLAGTGSAPVEVRGAAQQIDNPPNGTPAAISSIPLTGALAAVSGSLGLAGVAAEVPGQYARFESAPLPAAVEVVGAPTVSIRVAAEAGAAVVFVKVYDVDPDGTATLPDGQVAPVRLTGLPATVDRARPVEVTLPGIVRRVEAGHRLRVVVAAADQAYATPGQPAAYAVALGAGERATLTLPTVAGTAVATSAVLWRWVLAGLLAALLLGLVVTVLVARGRRRRAAGAVHPDHAGTPLVVRGLRKSYADGYQAVSDIGFTVRRGQVVGLLGPNGAGKTTTLRVLLGLTNPSAGEVYIFGHRLTPGAAVLSRLGALVEGPGFLPHLSGVDNLRAYWRATGRPAADARLDEALEIAGLGESVHRRVGTYSHGMRQRLAIAQAMLGLPELLVLDEPTDGLDPPQIAEMRRVLRRYATDGRAVLVSSHLLAEVEQTCTHAVVVHKGRVVADGPVDEIVGDSPQVVFGVSDEPAARRVLAGLAGVTTVPGGVPGAPAFEPGRQVVADLDGTPRHEVVAALVGAGVRVDRVVPRRRLEDAFLALVGEDSRGSGDR